MEQPPLPSTQLPGSSATVVSGAVERSCARSEAAPFIEEDCRRPKRSRRRVRPYSPSSQRSRRERSPEQSASLLPASSASQAVPPSAVLQLAPTSSSVPLTAALPQSAPPASAVSQPTLLPTSRHEQPMDPMQRETTTSAASGEIDSSPLCVNTPVVNVALFGQLLTQLCHLFTNVSSSANANIVSNAPRPVGPVASNANAFASTSDTAASV